MNKISVVLLAGVSLVLTGCGKQQSQQPSSQQSSMATVAQKMQSAVTQQSAEVQSAMTQQAQQTQQNVQQQAAEMAQKAQTLLTQAKQYLDSDKLDEAISTAQQVLKFDPKNLDAQKIIEQAKAKLKAMADQKAADVKSGLMNTLNTMGK
jgi:transcription elongation factor GreA-like protein